MIYRFGRLSIRGKLTLIVTGTAALVLVLAAIGAVASQSITLRRAMAQEMSALGDVIGANSVSALAFQDPDAATQTLAALRSQPSVEVAYVVMPSGEVFAKFEGAAGGRRPVFDAGLLKRALPNGYYEWSGDLVVIRPIRLERDVVGFIYIVASDTQVRASIGHFMRSIGLLAAGLLLVGWIVADRLQGLVSRPLLKLTATITAIARDKNYGIRAERTTSDEVGLLIDGFNEMLSEIEARDRQLQRHRENLEGLVASRTAELQRAVLLAEEANRTKTRFLASMSHELRTPLNAILGYSAMLQEEALEIGQTSFVADLKKINAAGRHLLDLIDAVLDLAKVEAGKMELHLDTFSIEAMLRDIGAVVQPLAAQRQNEFKMEYPESIGRMRADLTKVRQILLNLLGNACKFTEGGTVSLSARRQTTAQQEWIVFAIADTGIGIPQDQIGELFQEFHQLEVGARLGRGGTGLGLALSRRFCRMMGGEIEVKSTVGRGTTFTVTLPAVVSVDAPPEGDKRDTESKVPSRGTVLVIDDEEATRDLMRRLLTSDGFTVVTAGSGEEGLAVARETRPDAITLDVIMPGLDGWAVLSSLKSDPGLATIPVVMVTIVTERNLGFALGAADYLTKPLDRARLTAVLSQYCRQPQTVLVVDDDPNMRDLTRRMLDHDGHRALEAENGRVALELLSQASVALILLDLMMPEMDGFEFLMKIRAHPEWSGIPVVVITAKDLSNEQRRQLAGYVETIIDRGDCTKETLLAEVRSILDRATQKRG